MKTRKSANFSKKLEYGNAPGLNNGQNSEKDRGGGDEQEGVGNNMGRMQQGGWERGKVWKVEPQKNVKSEEAARFRKSAYTCYECRISDLEQNHINL